MEKQARTEQPGHDPEHDRTPGGRSNDSLTSSGIATTGGEPAGGAADRIQPPLAVRQSASATGAADGPVPGGAPVIVTDDPRPSGSG